MNSVANGKVILNTPIKKIYVQAGQVCGNAALTTWYSMNNVKVKNKKINDMLTGDLFLRIYW